MTERTVIAVGRCKTVTDAIAIRRTYSVVAPDVCTLVVDMSLLDRNVPDAMLLGVLLNMRRFFRNEVDIHLCSYPAYLPKILQVCRKESLFTLQ